MQVNGSEPNKNTNMADGYMREIRKKVQQKQLGKNTDAGGMSD
jgi:hypothetical protein